MTENDKLINYNLFYSRNKFDPVTFILREKINSYEDFVDKLSNMSVRSPGLEYYNKVINHIESKKVEPVQEKVEPVQEKVEPVQEKVEPVQEKVEPAKKTRRRARRKKN